MKEEKRGKNKTALTGYCFLRNDYRLREIIQYYMEKNNHSYRTLATAIGANENNVREFIRKGTKAISQWKVLEICKELGIELDLQIKTISERG